MGAHDPGAAHPRPPGVSGGAAVACRRTAGALAGLPLGAAQPPKAITPTVVQARPGATTTPMATKATPPLHHQAGLPKIAATPTFVDQATLLPKRGPQGAAARSVASREPASQP